LAHNGPYPIDAQRRKVVKFSKIAANLTTRR
jgi:hypothetical protein